MRPAFDLDALDAVALAAADEVARCAGRPLSVSHKDDRSPVTDVDRAVDALLARALRDLVPGSGWLSEETQDDGTRLALDPVWIVDPIDGTKQLVRGIPEVAISIGLVSDGRPVAAAVINPMTGERGVWVEGRTPRFVGLRPRVTPSSLEAAEAIVSRSESEAGDLDGLGPLVGATRAVGSVAYKLLRVASGADAVTFSTRPKSEWDVCGGVGLLTGAGAVYLRLDGEPLSFNRPETRIPSGAVAGPSALAEPLRERLLRSLAGRA